MGFVIGQIIGWVYMADAHDAVVLVVVCRVAGGAAGDCGADDDFDDRQPGDRVWIAGGVRRGAVSQRFERHARHDVHSCGRSWKAWRWALPLLHGGGRRRLRAARAVVSVAHRVWRPAPVRRGLVGVGAVGFWPRSEKIEQILLRFSDRTILTGERLSFDARQVLSYRLLLRDPARRGELRDELATAGDVQELSFYLQEDESEL